MVLNLILNIRKIWTKYSKVSATIFIRECNDIILDMSNDSNERKVLRSVFPLPCSSSSFPIQSLSVKVETDCDQSKNMFARFFSGACGSSRNGFIVMIKSSAF